MKTMQTPAILPEIKTDAAWGSSSKMFDSGSRYSSEKNAGSCRYRLRRFSGSYQRCPNCDFFESGSNNVLKILNPKPIRIRYQH